MSLPEPMKKEIPKLEDMQIHNWQLMAIGALQEAGEAYLLGENRLLLKIWNLYLYTKLW